MFTGVTCSPLEQHFGVILAAWVALRCRVARVVGVAPAVEHLFVPLLFEDYHVHLEFFSEPFVCVCVGVLLTRYIHNNTTGR